MSICPGTPQMPKSICVPEVAKRKRAKTGPLTLSTADGQPIIEITRDAEP